MKAHRSLAREDVLKYPPEKVALMVASEFWRAVDVASHPENVNACFARAGELLKILETMPMHEPVVSSLRPLFIACRAEMLEKVLREPPDQIKEICADFAERFDLIGMMK
jgi:hypothetical protein